MRMVTLQPYFIPPNEKQLEAINENFIDDLEKFQYNLILLQEWMNKNDAIPKNYDKRILPNYLRQCKNNIQKAQEKLLHYFSARANEKRFRSSLDMNSKRMGTLKKRIQLAVPRRLTVEGYRIILGYLAKAGESTFSFEDFVEYIATICNILNAEDVPNMGLVIIAYPGGFSVSTLAKFLSPLYARFLNFTLPSLAQILVAIHIVNANEAVIKVTDVLKRFLPKKLRNRIYFHKKPEDIKNFFSIDVLPKEWGGRDKSLAEMVEETADFVDSRKHYLIEQETAILKGNINHDEEYNFDEIFGTNGSFRKLNID